MPGTNLSTVSPIMKIQYMGNQPKKNVIADPQKTALMSALGMK